jgi:NAD(P)-dependent dehydrogenase (short-subunit alcohol dehydrogenase family)
MTTHSKVALVTGANKGIGFEIARGLAAGGFTVAAAARDAQLGRAAADELGVDAVQLDVTDAGSIAAAVATVTERHGRLDLLVNNAAITGGGRPLPSETTIEHLRAVYETNVFGVAAVTNAFLPLLRAAPDPQVVNVSSSLGSIGMHLDPATLESTVNLLSYCSSKTALNAMTVLYANELREAGVRFNAVNPGYTATDLNGFAGTQTPAHAAALVVRLGLADGGPTAAFLSAESGIAEGEQLPW